MKTKVLLFFLLLNCILSAQEKDKPNFETISDYIEIEKSQLTRHVLNDIPGSLVALIPKGGGKYDYKLLNDKFLLDSLKLPKVNLEPQVLTYGFSKKSEVLSVSFLNYIGASMKDEDEAYVTIQEASNSFIVNNDINWKKVEKRIKKFQEQNGNSAKGVIFGVVRVAAVISIENKIFKSVEKAGKISGFGFAGSGSYLSERGKETHKFKIGVDLIYNDSGIMALTVATKQKIYNKEIEKFANTPELKQMLNEELKKPQSSDYEVSTFTKTILPYMINSTEYIGELKF